MIRFDVLVKGFTLVYVGSNSSLYFSRCTTPATPLLPGQFGPAGHWDQRPTPWEHRVKMVDGAFESPGLGLHFAVSNSFWGGLKRLLWAIPARAYPLPPCLGTVRGITFDLPRNLEKVDHTV